MTNRAPQPNQYFNLGALLPQLLIRGFWILVEILLSLATLLILDRIPIMGHIAPWLSLLGLVLVVAGGEALYRNRAVSARLYEYLVTPVRWARGVPSVVRSRILKVSIMIWLDTIVFVVLISWFALAGLQQPTENHPPRAAEFITNAITLVAVLLTVFFAGAALIIELVAGAYSEEFVSSVLKRKEHLVALATLIIITMGNLAILWFGWNSDLFTASFLSALYIVTLFPLMAWATVHYVQIPNAVRVISDGISRFINGNLRQPPLPLRFTPDQPDIGLSLREEISFHLNVHLTGRLIPIDTTSLVGIEVPSAFSRQLSDKLRPIVSAALGATQRNRRDIVTACLEEIERVSSGYLSTRRNYSSMNDTYLMFLAGQYEILFEVALTVPNQQFTADLVGSAARVGLLTLDLTETQMNPYENGLTLTWTSLLIKFATKSLHLEHSSAPVDAIQGMWQMGEGLIKQGAFTTATSNVVDQLKSLGQTVATIQGAWPASLLQGILNTLVSMLLTYLQIIQKGKFYYEFTTSSICDAIRNIVEQDMKQHRDFYSLSILMAPLVGQLWQGNSLSRLVRYGLFPPVGTETRIRQRLLLELKPIIDLILLLSVKAESSKHHSMAEYSQTISIAGWLTIEFIRGEDNKDLTKLASDLLSKLLKNTILLIDQSLKSNPKQLRQHLFHLSPTMAYLIYYSRPGEFVDFIQLLEDELAELAGILKLSHEEGLEPHGLYSYVKMFTAWLHKYYPDAGTVGDLIELLAVTAPDDIEWMGIASRSETERLGYPSGLLGDEWFIFPSRYWPQPLKSEIESELNDMENYRHLADLVSSKIHDDDPDSEH